MKVLTTSPFQWLDGEVLDPADVNRVFRYGAQAFSDVASRRFALAPLVLPFGGYTQALSSEERAYRFVCPVTCTIERAELVANLVSTGEVKISLAASGSTSVISLGAVPTGASSPYLSTGAGISYGSADTTYTFVNADRVTLTAGTTYVFLVEAVGAATFTLTRADLVLWIRTDRWQTGASTTLADPSITYVRSAQARDATVIAANVAALSTAATSLASNTGALVPVLYVAHDFSGGVSDLTTFRVPRFNSTRADSRVVRMDVFAHWSAATSQSITANLVSNAPATVATAANSAGGTSAATGTTGTISQSLVQASSTVTTTVASDYTVQLSSSGATNVQKAYALLWISR